MSSSNAPNREACAISRETSAIRDIGFAMDRQPDGSSLLTLHVRTDLAMPGQRDDLDFYAIQSLLHAAASLSLFDHDQINESYLDVKGSRRLQAISALWDREIETD